MITKETIYSELLGRDVDVYVRLPKDFDKNEVCNVLYMHDGQNLFFKEDSSFGMIWDVDTVLNNLEKDGYERLIVIGISSNKSYDGYARLCEYSRFDNFDVVNWMKDNNTYESNKAILTKDVLIGKGESYDQFLINTIFKNYEKRFNINKRYMMGSSMGGLYTLEFALTYPDLISKAYCVSNAFHYALKDIKNYCEKIESVKIYLDCGTEESSQGDADNEKYINCNQLINDKLKELGNEVVFKIIPGAVHNEKAWNERLSNILQAI